MPVPELLCVLAFRRSEKIVHMHDHFILNFVKSCVYIRIDRERKEEGEEKRRRRRRRL